MILTVHRGTLYGIIGTIDPCCELYGVGDWTTIESWSPKLEDDTAAPTDVNVSLVLSRWVVEIANVSQCAHINGRTKTHDTHYRKEFSSKSLRATYKMPSDSITKPWLTKAFCLALSLLLLCFGSCCIYSGCNYLLIQNRYRSIQQTNSVFVCFLIFVFYVCVCAF